MTLTCCQCYGEFQGRVTTSFCSQKCRKEYAKEKAAEVELYTALKDMHPENDWICCEGGWMRIDHDLQENETPDVKK